MRKYFSGVALGAILLFQTVAAKADEIRLVPSDTSVEVGSSFTLDVIAKDINLGGYTLFVNYAAALVSMTNPVIFDVNLGEPFVGSFAEGLDLFGQVRLDELSFLGSADLESLQGIAPGNMFRLATLTFQANAAGTAVFDFDLGSAVLSSFSGQGDVTADLIGTTVQITSAGPTPVPEPSTWALMGVQIGAAVWMLRRRIS